MTKRNLFIRGGVLVLLVAMLGIMLASVLVACDPKSDDQPKVELKPQNAQTVFAESYDYKSLFTATVDGEPYEIKDEYIDASAVDLNVAGTYDVKCEIEVNGKKYSATAKLTVVAPAKFTVAPASSLLQAVYIGEEFDFTTLFVATVNSQPHALSASDIDISDVDLNTEGLYTVKASLTVDGQTKTAERSVYVIARTNADIVGAMTYEYDNYAAVVNVEEDDDGYQAHEVLNIKVAEGRYSYDSALVGRDPHTQFIFECDPQSGAATSAYYMDNGAWKKSSNTNYYADLYLYYVVADADFAEHFALGEDGMFYAIGDETTLTNYATNLLGYNTELMGDVSSLKVRVEDGKIKKIVVESAYTNIEDDYSDSYRITVELSNFDAISVDIPHVEPEVEITANNTVEVFVGDITEYNFLSLFTVKVDGDAYTINTEDGDSYTIEQNVDFNAANEYTVTLKLTVKGGQVQHTATAKFTVKEHEDLSFEQILAAAAQNCTFVKDGSTTYNFVGNYIYSEQSTVTYLYNIKDDLALKSYKVTGGEPTLFKETDTTPLLRLDLLKDLQYEDKGDGTYVASGTASGKSIADILKLCCIANATVSASKDAIIAKYIDGVLSFEFNYKFLTIEKTIVYTISNIGTTEIPCQLPTA